MTLNVEFSDEVEAQIDKLSETMGMCRADALAHALGTAIFLVEESRKGNRVVVKRTWPHKSVEVIL